MGTEETPSGKSRRERRKEARQAKNKQKFDSWVQHHSKKASLNLKLKPSIETVQDTASKNGISKVKTMRSNGSTQQPNRFEKSRTNRGQKRKFGSEGTPKTNFFKLLEMELGGKVPSAEEDLRLEKRLAKKLKLKKGKLSAADDLSVLVEGTPSTLDNLVSKKSMKINSVNEDIEEEISDDGDGEEFGLLFNSSGDNDDGGSDDYDDDDNDDDDDDDGGEVDEDDERDEESDSLAGTEDDDDIVDRSSPKKSNKGKRKKTKFEVYLGNDVQGGEGLGEADLALERKLAKKLKVKGGKVKGEDDDLNMLLEGIPSQEDNMDENRVNGALGTSSESGKGKYVAPHLRSRGGNESEEHAQLRKRVRGLLNRLSETNVESITGQVSSLYNSVGRSLGSQIVSEEVVASCSGGPRGNEQYAAIFAAFVSGMTCSVGMDFGAKLLARVAKCFEEEYLKEDNLSLRNLTLLFSYLYVFGLCPSELIYDFLIMLGKRLTEVDVSTVLTVLQCCGMKLRGDDPVGMKNFITSVQSRVNELKASSENGQSQLISKRMEFMLETICDIKNNKKKTKEDTVQHTRIKKWLQKLRVDEMLLRGLTWSKLLDPSKKGQWWSSGDNSSTAENVEEVAGTIDKEIPETKKMLQLAASQRMNTDARRAIFCIIMSGEDYIDAFEKLLRLDLPGKQDREIMRVLVECCLQEKVFNKYYCVLASKLCSHDKNHKFTLQYCLWDHFKELESMSLMRSMHLSKFTAEMIASFSLSLAVLKAVDLNDPMHLTSKRIMHFRMLFEAIFEFSDKIVWNIFTRIAVTPEYEHLRSGLEFFIRNYVVNGQKPLANKFKTAKKALNNIEGVLM
ncbi:MIF4G domain-containing protein / MA3 domain-containing protein [Striga hermonthica]|uniref:MIF4G domain-containing protein / MA3 domain-containing protein n=1 Tax=Striga hermonthica TaxID=68872 RepID=A0A9N7N2R9_STRHE|nr:MIF4G domain-containing protein / MA3 domain-containing protein [Striga hermonthica]